MEIDPSQSTKHKAEALQGFAAGPLSTSLAKLSGSSRGIPSDKDFHFYRNFNEFRAPVNEIVDASQSMLGTIGSSANLWGRELGFPEDLDDAYDWLVNVNDEVFERFDVSVDEFRSLRRKEEETGVPMTSSVDFDSGFQVVYGKKKKKKDGGEVPNSLSAVKLASRDKRTMGPKAKVPFHIRSIPRPQDEFKILVNNSTQPFQHVWLQRSEDGSRSVHPQENFTALDFVDKNIGDFESLKPPPLESTPFNYVDEVKDLKELVAKLRDVDEFAVDLEHNQYRSFQGLTCLMQISTRTEDFVVDTLKLRIQIGPYLRELFKDPTKKKVMHGADRDILWLQRDFGIYICNLFDTGQASRVLKLERNSLEYLLFHFCGVTANKEYQNADWRLRPLPEEMLRYAREDTHYLLHIYDLLRIRLLSEKSDDLLVEVYKRSYDLCMQLYEKELLTESSYLHIYGLQGADLNAQQLAVVAGLCEWRDVVARAEDESTGYILPNKTLLEIAKQMPVTTTKLLHLVKSKHPCVERNLNSVVSVIKQSMQNAVAFETAAERLKEERMEKASQRNIVSTDRSEAPPEVPAGLKTTATTENQGAGMSGEPPAPSHFRGTLKLESNFAEISKNVREGALEHNGGQNASIESQTSDNASRLQGESPITSGQSKEGAIAAIHVLQKPSHAFGAMLGSSSGKRKLVSDKKEKEAMKLEQIQSSVSFPFHSFSGMDEQLQPPVEGMRHDFPPAVQGGVSNLGDVILLDFPPAVQGGVSNLGDVILLDDNACVEGTSSGEPTREQLDHNEEHIEGSDFEMAEGDEAMSLTDLSSSFQRCFQSTSQARKLKQAGTSKDPEGLLQLKPFDYEGARRQIKFGEGSRAEPKEKGDEGHADRSRVDPVDRASSAATSAGDSLSQSQSRRDDEGTRNLAQGRRRQAFPASGNRSATFR